MSKADGLAGWQQGLEDGALRFPQCDDCVHWNWYPLPRCRNCGGAGFTWTEVAPAGTLYSWTRVHRSFGGPPVAPVPYITGIIDINDAPGVRLPCLNTQAGETPIIGAPVNLRLDRAASGPRWMFEINRSG